MGGSSASAADMAARTSYRNASGTSFDHSRRTAAQPRHLQTIHESVDPKRKNTANEQIRECIDSDAHPLTLPVVVGFDETGSMGEAPMILQQKLGTLKGATLRMGLDDAQLCFAAYGDAHCGEVAPCQVGQFESGTEMEDWLNNLYLEGNGGGNGGETSGLLLYFLANFSRLDSLTKRGKKGYLILTGDECPHRMITRSEVKEYIGVNIEADLTIEEVVKQAQESYEVYFLLVDNSSARAQGSQKVWENLLGVHNVVVVESLDTVSELIALLIARAEGVVDSLDAGTELLLAEGANPDDVRRAGQALMPFDAHVGSVVKSTADGKLPEPATSGSATKRL